MDFSILIKYFHYSVFLTVAISLNTIFVEFFVICLNFSLTQFVSFVGSLLIFNRPPIAVDIENINRFYQYSPITMKATDFPWIF